MTSRGEKNSQSFVKKLVSRVFFRGARKPRLNPTSPSHKESSSDGVPKTTLSLDWGRFKVDLSPPEGPEGSIVVYLGQERKVIVPTHPESGEMMTKSVVEECDSDLLRTGGFWQGACPDWGIGRNIS